MQLYFRNYIFTFSINILTSSNAGFMIFWLQLQHETMPESGGSWWGYGASLASLAANIVENIQVCEFVE